MTAKKKTAKKKKVGRPTKYTEKLALDICEKIASGRSLRSISKEKGMPSVSTVMRWLLDPERQAFWEHYAKARSIQAELLFDETIDIADDGTNDWQERELNNGEVAEVLNSENIQRSRLRVDTRKWYISKVLPKKYGERSQLDLTTDGDKITGITVEIINATKPESDTSLREEQQSEDTNCS